jgi:hypothetical protein
MIDPTILNAKIAPNDKPQFLYATKKNIIATIKLLTEAQNVNLKPFALVNLLLNNNINGIGAKADEFITVICHDELSPIEFDAILVWLNKNRSSPKKKNEKSIIHQI